MIVMYRSCFVFVIGVVCIVVENVVSYGVSLLDTCVITSFDIVLVGCSE